MSSCLSLREVSTDRNKWDVLVTNGSTRVAYNVLRSLARSGLKVGLGASLDSGMAQYSRYGVGAFRHPSSELNPQEFVAVLQEKLLVHRPAVYLPADEDVFVVAKLAHLLRDLPVRTAIAPFETLELLDNKHQSAALANAVGVPVPATILPASTEEIIAFARDHSARLVLKIIRSSGARGVYMVQPEKLGEILPAIFQKNNCGFGDFIVQEFVQGTGYGVSMLFDHGQMKASFTHCRLRERSPSGGPSTLRMSVRQPVLEAHAERLLRHVGYHGVAMVEFRHDAVSGKTWFLEVNPRWWGSLALAIQAGVDFPMLYYRLALGETLPPPPDYKTGVTVRWLLGDILAVKNQCFAERRLPVWREIWPAVEGYDDVHANDPFPLAAELVLYLMKTVRQRARERAGDTP